jgi:hypothetical protein
VTNTVAYYNTQINVVVRRGNDSKNTLAYLNTEIFAAIKEE